MCRFNDEEEEEFTNDEDEEGTSELEEVTL